MSEVEEHWLPVVGYEASDQGRIRSVDRVITCSDGRERRLTGKVLKAHPNGGGYPCVDLCHGGVRTLMPVGRLVLLAHVGPAPPHCEMCHRPGYDRDDCRLEALYWGTHSHNASDYQGNRYLNPADILRIRQLRAAGVTTVELADEYDRAHTTIGQVCRGETYKHAPGPRVFGSDHCGDFKVITYEEWQQGIRR